MTYSDRLVSLRKLHGLTQKQLATALNMSELAIQHYESKRRKPSHDALIALADYFKVPADYLLGRGMFANWEEIIENKTVILQQLEDKIPTLTSFNLIHASSETLMRILPTFVESIEFDESGNVFLLCYY